QEPVKKMFRAAVFFAVVAVAFCAAYNKVDTKAYAASSAKDYSGNQAGSNYNGNQAGSNYNGYQAGSNYNGKGASNYNGYQAGSNSYNSYDQGY
ncbi:hypothetical protein BgiBS90_019212, partial [Biomphalaria glabrata]